VDAIGDATGVKKYSKLTYLTRTALTIIHSIAVPERGFSCNNSLITKERASLSEKTDMEIRNVKDVIRLYGSCTSVPITKDLLTSVKQARAECLRAGYNEKRT